MEGDAGDGHRGHSVCFPEGTVLSLREFGLTVSTMHSSQPLASSPPNLLLLPCSSSQQKAHQQPRRWAQPGTYSDNLSLSQAQQVHHRPPADCACEPG